MIGLNDAPIITPTPVACFDVQQELQKQAYSITFEVVREHGVLLSSLSDCSILTLDLETMKSIHHIPQAHEKRINGLHLDNNVLYTCSNDGTIKVWDLKSEKPLMGQCRGPSQQEFYSLAQTQHILAGGGEGDILFWDLRRMKLLNSFNETHSDEVTSLQFVNNKPSILMSSSLDGMICLFDLSQDNEDEATDTVIRLEQPVNSCKFIGESFSAGFAQTTVQTIAVLSFENAQVAKEINTIENLDTNPYALLGAYTVPNENSLYYLRGNLEGLMEEYEINLYDNVPVKMINKYTSQHQGPITKAERITDRYVLSTGEDCKFLLTEKTEVNDFIDFAELQKAMFLEDDNTTAPSNCSDTSFRKKKKNFDYNPFK